MTERIDVTPGNSPAVSSSAAELDIALVAGLVGGIGGCFLLFGAIATIAIVLRRRRRLAAVVPMQAQTPQFDTTRSAIQYDDVSQVRQSTNSHLR